MPVANFTRAKDTLARAFLPLNGLFANNFRKHPRRRNSSLVISALFSVYNAIDQGHQRAQQDMKLHLATLDAAIADIVAIRMEDTKQMAALASTNLAAYRAWNSSATLKRAMLIDAAMSEVKRLGNKITPAGASALGNELNHGISEANKLRFDGPGARCLTDSVAFQAES